MPPLPWRGPRPLSVQCGADASDIWWDTIGGVWTLVQPFLNEVVVFPERDLFMIARSVSSLCTVAANKNGPSLPSLFLSCLTRCSLSSIFLTFPYSCLLLFPSSVISVAVSPNSGLPDIAVDSLGIRLTATLSVPVMTATPPVPETRVLAIASHVRLHPALAQGLWPLTNWIGTRSSLGELSANKCRSLTLR